MIWRALKYILSGLLLLLAGLSAFVYFSDLNSSLMLGLSGFFIVLAATLWLDFIRAYVHIGDRADLGRNHQTHADTLCLTTGS
ncbi:MAG: hypothetical protein AB1452_09825 [Pseudomonadota bacterium]